MKYKIDSVYGIDCFEFLKKLDDEIIDLAIVDPPYNMKKTDWDVFRNVDEYLKFTFNWIDLLIPKLKPTASLYIFNTPFNNSYILRYLINKKLHFKNWITWYKKDGFSASKRRFVNNQETILLFTVSEDYTFNYNDIRIPYLSKARIKYASKKGILKNGKRWFPNEKGRLCPDVWEFSSERHKVKINGKTPKLPHPTSKPLDLIKRIVAASSNKGDLVLDLFSGMGTTALACKLEKRHFIGCENNYSYYQIILRRLENVFAKSN